MIDNNIHSVNLLNDQKKYFKWFEQFINTLDRKFSKTNVEKFLAIWVPTNVKYLNSSQIYSLTNVLEDILICSNIKNMKDIFSLINFYKAEYYRMFKVKQLIMNLCDNSHINQNSNVVDLTLYKQSLVKKKDKFSKYVKGYFKIKEINFEGNILVEDLATNKLYKILYNPELLRYFQLEDVLKATLKKKSFLIHWDVERINSYYNKNVLKYLSERLY
ncbi:hypothetical protein AN640_00645 [Candidatus Epulonipiscium fishelsonii]|uniref:Uncharacterized protein n=1 Tax=Candidatus Epulonipiscium fishelsonii TaxID=77094 RepID=A0ACC8XJD0_9FIRM|nr:hypothetical protein AN640_00645 [Epulopiscium sp. SCG-D08WGA-EpuloA1]OON92732.1 MAG: hypothetical protein ATN32_01955 [Epulopiscium sp. AS2M-Bin002]